MQRTKLSILTLIAGLMLAGCGPDELLDVGRGALATVAEAPKPVAKFALRTTDARTDSPEFKASFEISSTYELFLAADLANVGHHTAVVVVKMPNGDDYQRFEVSVAAGVAPAQGEVAAESLSLGYRTWVSVPVAGTMIEQYWLSGPWSAELYVDGSSVATARVEFELM